MCRMWRNESQKGTAQSSADRRRWICIGYDRQKNGRGAYVCLSSECFAKAVKNKGLERSFKQAIPKEVYERLEKEMEQFEAR